MSAGKYNIQIEQGADWNLTLVWRDDAGNAIDPSEFTARMAIVENVGDRRPLHLLTTENGGITMNAEDTAIELYMPAAATEGWRVFKGRYDLELVDSEGRVTRLLQGRVNISPNATR